MQSTSETWKALAARIGAPEYTPGTQSLGLYSGNDPVYLTGSGKHIVLKSGDQVIYNSDNRQIVEVYSGDTRIYSSGTIEEYGETVTLESRVTIGGSVYAANITSPKITRALTQAGPGVGNAVSAMCQFSILTDNAIARAATVLVEQRLTDGTATSEWLPAGTFYVSKRQRDPVTGVLTLECYDALLKANAVWTPSSGAWPRTMGAVVTELAGLLGVSLDSRNIIPNANISEPAAGTTIRDALGSIAQAGGGNWIITPANRLRLVQLADAADAAGATADVIDVRGNVGRFTLGAAGAITGVRDTWEDEVYLTGDETGLVLDVSIPPTQAADLASAVIGLQYQPFGLSAALYDPAAELGDWVRAGANGEIRSVLYAETVTLSPAFRGDISAPEGGELYDEYPYIGGNAKTLTLAKAYATEAAAEAVAGLDEELTQQEIFDRLTDNGAAQGLVMLNGQLYVNASYLRSGTIDGTVVNAKLLNIVDANGNVIASFNNTITLGDSNDAHALIDFNSFEIFDKDGTVLFSAGDMRGNNGYATVTENFIADGFAWYVNVYNTISSVNSVTVNGTEVAYTRLGQHDVNLSFTPDAGDVISVTYTTGDVVNFYDLGNRSSGSPVGIGSVVEGNNSEASGPLSHCEGSGCIASEYMSHAEGENTTASNRDAHAEGEYSVASGRAAHAESRGTASGYYSHAEGNETEASGHYSHAEGWGTVANHMAQHVFGEYNIEDPSTNNKASRGNYIEIVGKGTNTNNRSNARTLDWNGNEYIAGALSVGNPAGTRSNLDITPANIGAVNLAGDTMTGALALPLLAIRGSTFQFLTFQNANGDELSHVRGEEANNNIVFREWNADRSYYEDYYLPVASSSSQNVQYSILTTKTPVSIAQGGTGATTASGALDNLGIKHKTVTAMTNAKGAVTVSDVDLQGTRYQVISAMCTSETALCLPVFYTTSSTNGWQVMVKDRQTLAEIASTMVQIIITYIDFGSAL